MIAINKKESRKKRKSTGMNCQFSVLVKCFWKAALEEKLFPLKDSDGSVCVCVSEGMRGVA